ncbi:MAG: murein biosynthesis integral membrane protein MurJ, partial [Anaerolineales bacterium]|nr:murein biosynthesis integral membrane protein MurJ [Anaerolineales bacterium]
MLESPPNSPEPTPPALAVGEIDAPLAPQDTTHSPIGENRGVVRAAVIIALGNIIQRLLGMGREVVKANLFGASGLLSAYNVAALVPMTLYQLIVGGEMVTSSLVPVFSDYASKKGTAEEVALRRDDLWQVVSTVLSLATVLLLAVVLLVELFAPQVAWLVGAHNFDDPALYAITVDLMRLSMPAVLFLSLSSIITAVLYALQRFTLPAFTVAAFNGTIIIIALLRPTEIDSLVWGLLLGSILMVLLQLPAMRDARLRWNMNWNHPAVRRIVRLYLPIVGVLIVNQAVIWISYRLAIQTGDASITYMQYATTLYQLPLGLVVMGLSIATLPMLAQQAQHDPLAFKRTLSQGLRLVVTLIVPATFGLFALAEPIVALLFEHGQFLPQDTLITAQVLRVYLLGLSFAAVDQMLIYASYARKDTWRPALVGVISLGFYLVVALVLLQPLGLLSLMAADASKHFLHTMLMMVVMYRHIGTLRGHGIGRALWKSLLAASITGLSAFLAYEALLGSFFASAPTTLLVRLVLVVVPASVG